MAGSFTNNGDGTITVSFDFTADLDKAQNAVNKASEFVYSAYMVVDNSDPLNPIITPWEDLTNQEKLDVLDKHIKRTIMDAARAQLIQTAVNDARDLAEVDDSIDLGTAGS
jgi:multidrug efflux pump subunit AcrB